MRSLSHLPLGKSSKPSTPQKLAIVGAGGFAREVRWLIEEINRLERRFDFRGFVVSDTAKLGANDSKDLVLGDLDWIEENTGEIDALALGFGNPKARDAVGSELQQRFPNLAWPVLLHPSVVYDSRSCEFAPGVLVCAGVIATVGVRLRRFAMINLSCTLGHESIVGRGSVLNPTVNVSGGVEIGDRVLVGTGAQILQYVTIGDEATVGAGAVVTKAVGAGATVVGVPAKPLG